MSRHNSKVFYGKSIDPEDEQEIREHVAKCVKLARERQDLSLIKAIQNKRRMQNFEEVELILYKDWAPYSLYFDLQNIARNYRIYNGGIIFHGKHDGFGSGSAPTFSVCLTATDGWSTHT
jgi:hypothetical protein